MVCALVMWPVSTQTKNAELKPKAIAPAMLTQGLIRKSINNKKKSEKLSIKCPIGLGNL